MRGTHVARIEQFECAQRRRDAVRAVVRAAGGHGVEMRADEDRLAIRARAATPRKEVADAILREGKPARACPLCEQFARRALLRREQGAIDAAFVCAEHAQRIEFFDNVHGLWFAIQ